VDTHLDAHGNRYRDAPGDDDTTGEWNDQLTPGASGAPQARAMGPTVLLRPAGDCVCWVIGSAIQLAHSRPVALSRYVNS
jgi:hypothetical protein